MSQEQWGCHKPVMQFHVFGNDKPQSLCPLRYFRDHPDMEATAFTLHMNWRKGILPAAGGLDDQAAGYSAVVTATDVGVSAARERLQQVNRDKASRQNRGKGAQKRAPSRRSAR